MLDIRRPDLDFVALATGMGVSASRATTAEEFNDQLARAFATPGPFGRRGDGAVDHLRPSNRQSRLGHRLQALERLLHPGPVVLGAVVDTASRVLPSVFDDDATLVDPRLGDPATGRGRLERVAPLGDLRADRR